MCNARRNKRNLEGSRRRSSEPPPPMVSGPRERSRPQRAGGERERRGTRASRASEPLAASAGAAASRDSARVAAEVCRHARAVFGCELPPCRGGRGGARARLGALGVGAGRAAWRGPRGRGEDREGPVVSARPSIERVLLSRVRRKRYLRAQPPAQQVPRLRRPRCASTTGSGTSARSAAGRAYASTNACVTSARTAAGALSASTSACARTARFARGRRFARTDA